MLSAGLSHLLHLLTEALIGALGVLGFAACVLTWRLAQGPIDISPLAHRMEASLSSRHARLSIGRAALAWEGFHSPGHALDLRVGDVVVTGDHGIRLAELPQGNVTLAILPLLFGRIVPNTLDLDAPVFELRRDAAGSIQLDLAPEGGPSRPEVSGSGAEILHALTQPATPDSELPWLNQLSKVSIRHAKVTVRDAALGLVWQAPQATINLKRLRNGGVTGTAALDLSIGAAHGTLTVRAELRSDGTHVTASTTPVSPAALAQASSSFSALAILDAPIAAVMDADLDERLSLRTLRLNLDVAAGTLHAGTGAVGLQAATAQLSATAAGAHIEAIRIALAPLAGGHAPPPVITATANASWEHGDIASGFTIDLDRLDLADLQRYWPPAIGGGSRVWLVQNLTAGNAHGLHVAGTIGAKRDFSGISVTRLSGGLDADELEVGWLRPIPPIQHGRAHLVIDGPDALHIAITSGVEQGLRIVDGSVSITGLTARHQTGTIDIGVEGALSDALRLLDHPRLKLLSRRHIDLTEPGGTLQAKLTVKLPLDDDVELDAIAIAATATLADVHLGNVAAGRAIDDGQLTLGIDNDGLKVSGTADFAGIPSTLAVTMDFRLGPSEQVIEHVSATGRADRRQLEAAGLPAKAAQLVTGGTIDLAVDYTARRNASAIVGVSADLSNAALATPVGWSKVVGAPTTVSARMMLRHDKIAAIEGLTADGPGLKLASQVDMKDGRVAALVIHGLELNRTRATGRIEFPGAGRGSMDIALSGSVLDLSPALKSAPDAVKTAARTNAAPNAVDKGPGWTAELAFDQVLLAKDARLDAVKASLVQDGARITAARLTAGGKADVTATITTVPGGRTLAIDAHDAGPVLAAFGVADNLHGGVLSVEARYDDSLQPPPLVGTATLSEFNLTDAPAIGRLLQAMTLYGLTDLLRGPGLHFSRMVAPFRWRSGVLHLENARAFSSSLGLTAAGDLDLDNHQARISGTVVPAYFFNQLPGKIPLLGRLFSPEKGGGLFAASYAVHGKLSNPTVTVNPLSALTPGFLRGIFGLFAGPSPAGEKPARPN